MRLRFHRFIANFVEMYHQTRAIQRAALLHLPKNIQVRTIANGQHEDQLPTETTKYVKTFMAAIKKEDPVVRTLRQVKIDYDKMSTTGKQTLVINTVLANLYLGVVIGPVPLLSGVGAYLSYKYFKHTGKLAQLRESFRSC
ncbi:hypothetical protein ACOME3_003617 [Neoechinorhynchus agilis]